MHTSKRHRPKNVYCSVVESQWGLSACGQVGVCTEISGAFIVLLLGVGFVRASESAWWVAVECRAGRQCLIQWDLDCG